TSCSSLRSRVRRALEVRAQTNLPLLFSLGVTMSLRILSLCLLCSSGCVTIVQGHERALYYSAREGMKPEPVPAGWYWHAPWNGYEKYDLRWTSHAEEIHIHSKDGLHMNITVVSVVRAEVDELYPL